MAGVLGEALERALRHPVELTCAGRTDAGVHAWGQVVSLDADARADLARLQRALNKLVGPAVAVREVRWAPAAFDARRSALSRRYRYQVLTSPWPDPLTAATTWHVGHDLDLKAMQTASDALLGEHDFASFCHAVRGRPGPLTRRVLRADWQGPDVAGPDRAWFEIEAWAFCHQMVRSIVGTLVEVGRGRLRAGDMLAILDARDRAAAGPIAPPHGLCLMEVRYAPAPYPADDLTCSGAGGEPGSDDETGAEETGVGRKPGAGAAGERNGPQRRRSQEAAPPASTTQALPTT